MKFKVGDRVICIDDSKSGIEGRNLKKGKEYSIVKITEEYVYVVTENGETIFFWPGRFKLAKQLITEVDFLNAFQQNFKDGE